MKTKVAIAVSAVLASASMMANAGVTVSKPNSVFDQIKPLVKSNKTTSAVRAVFTPERDLAPGSYRYFVRLNESPVALYQGGIEGFPATNPAVAKNKSGKLSLKDKSVKAYKNYLTSRQSQVISKAKSVLGKLNVKQQTSLAYNGFVVEMTQEDAIKLATVPGIAHIYRETLRYPTTDAGPQFIKADQIWEGASTGTASKGEGIVVGIIDTGINTDNPAFADVGGDGYDHTNPWGEGVYSGDCATEEWAGLCNDKLIGVHSYSAITGLYQYYDPEVPLNGEDHNGHGSHVAGTVAGNYLSDVEGGGVVFDQISGVAPHANIVSYQVCLPGENDAIGFSGCYPSLTILAVEHAIEAGVDALNYSIGGGSSNPWEDADSLAFLAARQAGIHVATSAGNSGPEAGTVGSPGDAPWISTVAAATHSREIVKNVNINGEDYNYATSSGPALTETLEAPIIYAANVAEDNVEGCTEFAANSFDDSIALISRGSCAFADKINNAAAAGAQAVIVHNNRDGDAILGMGGTADTTIPAILISENAGAEVLAALEAVEGLTASINPDSVIAEVEGGELASFSSRGANASVPDVIVPSISAPGVSIFAPYADDQSAGFKENPSPADFAFLSGTSMASPHIAGALALLADLQPNWSPAAAQSALMLTANQGVKNHDGTQADFFDMGAGMADVDLAAQTGLVVDENYNGYMSANPSVGGKPAAMNLASMGNASCVDTCTWTRTVTGTKSADWTAVIENISESATYTVSPESFSLSAGQTQEITVTADVSEAGYDWNFANLALTADGTPDARMPIAVKAGGDNLPETLEIVASRNAGSLLLPGFKAKGMEDITAAAYDKVTALIEPAELFVPETGYDLIVVSFDEEQPNVKFSTTASTAPDVDLQIYDASFNSLGSSAGPTEIESVLLTNLPAGTYYVVVWGYQASTPGGSDPVTVEVSSIQFDDASLSDSVAVDALANDTGFDLQFAWTSAEQSSGMLALTSSDGKVKQLPYSIVRGESDVDTDVSSEIVEGLEQLQPGVAQEISFDIAPNFESVDKVYTLTLSAPSHEFANVTNDGEVADGEVTWTVTRKAGESSEVLTIAADLLPRKSGEDFTLTVTNELAGDVEVDTYQFSVPEVAPTAIVNYAGFVHKGDLVQLDATSSFDANADAISFQWTQRSGKPVGYASSSPIASFVAPSGGKDGEVMTFDLVVTDANGNTDSAAVTFTITQNKGGGSMGYLLLLLLPLIGLRRRK